MGWHFRTWPLAISVECQAGLTGFSCKKKCGHFVATNKTGCYNKVTVLR